jgi:hypothetical protein
MLIRGLPLKPSVDFLTSLGENGSYLINSLHINCCEREAQLASLFLADFILDGDAAQCFSYMI